MAPLTLGYWYIRGRAEPIRLLLYYSKVEFVDKRYTKDNDEWLQDKFNLGLEFPNLPYLIDGDVRITQSITILRYLAEKYGLDGRTPDEKLKVTLMEQQNLDLGWFFLRNVLFKEATKETRDKFKVKVPHVLKAYEKCLGDRNFFVGDGVTYVDFQLCELFDMYRYYIPDVCKNFPKLMAHQARIAGLPGIKEYLCSPTYVRWPMVGPNKDFGAGPEPKRD